MGLGSVLCPHCGALHPFGSERCTKTGQPLPQKLHRSVVPPAGSSTRGLPDAGSSGRALPAAESSGRLPEAAIVPKVVAGRYQVLERLGAGGVAQVFRGQDLMLKRPVAVKVMRADFLDRVRPQDREGHVLRLLQEAQLTTAIGHPNIRSVFDTGRLPDGTAYLVMELLEGAPLDAHLRLWGSLTLAESIDILAQVLSGLDAAHEHRIVHRDIKPGNIFLCGAVTSPHVKILDFGFAKALDSAPMVRTRKSIRLGTRGYMSPEQLMGDAIDGRSDVFAVGLVLYELLSGKRPFPIDSELPRRLMHEQPPPLSSLHPAFKAVDPVLFAALEKAPARRYPSARAFQRDLMALRHVPGATVRLRGEELPSLVSSGTSSGASSSGREDDAVTEKMKRPPEGS